MRAVVPGGLLSALLYLLLVAWALPGTVDIVAALPLGARIGVLLLASTATRFLGGWVARAVLPIPSRLPERGWRCRARCSPVCSASRW